jgi:hypothetical protein
MLVDKEDSQLFSLAKKPSFFNVLFYLELAILFSETLQFSVGSDGALDFPLQHTIHYEEVSAIV